MFWTIDEVLEYANGSKSLLRPAPKAPIGHRFRSAWLVLIGKADAIIWREKE